MAAIDFSSIIMKDGKSVEALAIGPYRVGAYKHWLTFEKGDDIMYVSSEDDIRQLPEAVDVRTIPLIGPDDLARRKRNAIKWAARAFDGYTLTSDRTGRRTDVRKVLGRHPHLIPWQDDREVEIHIFRIADSTMVLFPYSPAWGGATYAYILGGDGSLSTIATGYGHYANPALHWMDRGLSKEAEEEIRKGLWRTMTDPRRFGELLVEQVFKGVVHHVDGGLAMGGGMEDTITDSAILALHSRLEEMASGKR